MFRLRIRPAPERRRSGLSIIELVVVIAMLCLLAAMLFPMFARARGTSYIVVCKSNLRQLGTAFMLYSEDWQGQWPCPGGLPGDRGYWSQSAGGGLQSYTRERGLGSVWCCPLLTQWEGRFPPRSYSMNSYLREPADKEYPTCTSILKGVNTAKITQRRATILLFEGVPLSGGWQDVAYSEDQIYYIYRCANWTWVRGYYGGYVNTVNPGRAWHGTVNNYLYCDCHISARPPGRRTATVLSTGREMYEWRVDKARYMKDYRANWSAIPWE